MAANSGALDTEKKQEREQSAKEKASLAQVTGFFTDAKSEFKKITWTTKEELILYTKVVVVATFVFGFAIYMIDLAIQGALSLLTRIVMFVAG